MNKTVSRCLFIILCCIGGCWLSGCKKQTVQKTKTAAQTDSLGGSGDPATPGGDSVAIAAEDLRGINWAANADNFSDGILVLSGLDSADNYTTVSAKAAAILASVISLTGANTIRLPVNPATVAAPWWNSYTGVIDEAVSKGMHVILCCWEGASFRDGKVDDGLKFWAMWQKIVDEYGHNPNVFFEIFNEPYGYKLSEWTTICALWLSRFPAVPKGRILISGTGYSEDIKDEGADPRFKGCLLSLHDYVFFNGSSDTTAAQWEARLKARIGDFGSRAVMTEFGVPMTGGKDYAGAVKADPEIAYLQGLTHQLRLAGMGAVYWPGIRNADSYRLLQLEGSGTSLSVSVTNRSGLNLLRYAWGLSPDP